MKDLFLYKLNNMQYISLFLFNNIKENYSEIIPTNFDLNIYNENILNKEYYKYKEYFDNMYNEIDPNIHLDEEQIKAILADENHSLILAGAGTGKTTTMASKVKYLVDIKKVDPNKILVISYTKKATEELIKRINIDFNIPAKISTFHSIGYEYIKNYFKTKKCYIVDDNLKNKIFLNYLKEKIFPDKAVLQEVMNLFNEKNTNETWIFGKFLKQNFNKYNSYDEYFKAYKEYKRLSVSNLREHIETVLERDYNQEYIYTINNELVKSKGEAIIANYLFIHNIPYKYEKIYKDVLDDYKIYKPDFTLNLGGQEVYLEYFGLSNYEGNELNTYKKIMNKKIEYHKKHKNLFIKIDSMQSENIIKILHSELIKYGFNITRKSDEEIYDALLNRNPLIEIFPLKNLFYNVISTIKSSSDRKKYSYISKNYIESLRNEEKIIHEKQFSYISDFYKYYQNKLFNNPNKYGIDFEDMLYYGKECILRLDDNNFKYKYLIIDEYQDVSFEKYSLAQTIVNKNRAKITAVGDDWQTIYSYSGSRISYIYNFQKYFPNSKILNITRTYRNSQELINYTGNFIMKNEDQIKKKLISEKRLDNPIKFVSFDEGDEILELKKIINHIHKNNPKHNILILARTNKTINDIFNDQDFVDDLGTKVKFMNYDDLTIDAMTIHKSKGLTADQVIIIGLNQSFPSNGYYKFWMINLFSNKIEQENIEFAEERRVFYVALTRTKNYVYLLVNQNPKNRSPFISELHNMIKELDNQIV